MQNQVNVYEEFNYNSPYAQNVIVVGNKADIKPKKRQVTYEDVDIWSEN